MIQKKFEGFDQLCSDYLENDDAKFQIRKTNGNTRICAI